MNRFQKRSIAAQIIAVAVELASRVASDFLEALLRGRVTLPGHRWTKKSRSSLVTQRLAGPLHAHQGHSEGP